MTIRYRVELHSSLPSVDDVTVETTRLIEAEYTARTMALRLDEAHPAQARSTARALVDLTLALRCGYACRKVDVVGGWIEVRCTFE